MNETLEEWWIKPSVDETSGGQMSWTNCRGQAVDGFMPAAPVWMGQKSIDTDAHRQNTKTRLTCVPSFPPVECELVSVKRETRTLLNLATILYSSLGKETEQIWILHLENMMRNGRRPSQVGPEKLRFGESPSIKSKATTTGTNATTEEDQSSSNTLTSPTLQHQHQQQCGMVIPEALESQTILDGFCFGTGKLQQYYVDLEQEICQLKHKNQRLKQNMELTIDQSQLAEEIIWNTLKEIRQAQTKIHPEAKMEIIPDQLEPEQVQRIIAEFVSTLRKSEDETRENLAAFKGKRKCSAEEMATQRQRLTNQKAQLERRKKAYYTAKETVTKALQSLEKIKQETEAQKQQVAAERSKLENVSNLCQTMDRRSEQLKAELTKRTDESNQLLNNYASVIESLQSNRQEAEQQLKTAVKQLQNTADEKRTEQANVRRWQHIIVDACRQQQKRLSTDEPVIPAPEIDSNLAVAVAQTADLYASTKTRLDDDIQLLQRQNKQLCRNVATAKQQVEDNQNKASQVAEQQEKEFQAETIELGIDETETELKTVKERIERVKQQTDDNSAALARQLNDKQQLVADSDLSQQREQYNTIHGRRLQLQCELQNVELQLQREQTKHELQMQAQEERLLTLRQSVSDEGQKQTDTATKLKQLNDDIQQMEMQLKSIETGDAMEMEKTKAAKTASLREQLEQLLIEVKTKESQWKDVKRHLEEQNRKLLQLDDNNEQLTAKHNSKEGHHRSLEAEVERLTKLKHEAEKQRLNLETNLKRQRKELEKLKEEYEAEYAAIPEEKRGTKTEKELQLQQLIMQTDEHYTLAEGLNRDICELRRQIEQRKQEKWEKQVKKNCCEVTEMEIETRLRHAKFILELLQINDHSTTELKHAAFENFQSLSNVFEACLAKYCSENQLQKSLHEEETDFGSRGAATKFPALISELFKSDDKNINENDSTLIRKVKRVQNWWRQLIAIIETDKQTMPAKVQALLPKLKLSVDILTNVMQAHVDDRSLSSENSSPVASPYNNSENIATGSSTSEEDTTDEGQIEKGEKERSV